MNGYYSLLLAEAALTYSPLRVLWTGASIASWSDLVASFMPTTYCKPAMEVFLRFRYRAPA